MPADAFRVACRDDEALFAVHQGHKTDISIGQVFTDVGGIIGAVLGVEQVGPCMWHIPCLRAMMPPRLPMWVEARG
jgi:hypothetical protein